MITSTVIFVLAPHRREALRAADVPDVAHSRSDQEDCRAYSGVWYCVEAHVRLNDPGSANGVQEFWINGNLEASSSDLDCFANQVFLELSNELQAQGVSRKVSADMFGMALRAYIRKVRRLSEGQTEQGRTLWQAVLDFVKSESVVPRSRVLERFARDGELEVSAGCAREAVSWARPAARTSTWRRPVPTRASSRVQ
jgi:hypothetical protein